MKVRIRNDWWTGYIQRQPGKTWADKKSTAERVFSGKGNNLAKSMQDYCGKWVMVEIAHLFEDKFNIEEPNICLMVEDVDRIDFSPEFESLQQFEKAVGERYAKDWPGREPEFRKLYALLGSNKVKILEKRKLYTAIVYHEFFRKNYSSFDKDELEYMLYNYVREWWNQEIGEDVKIPDMIQGTKAREMYFDTVENEYIEFHENEVMDEM
jgi:hypothetical protein